MPYNIILIVLDALRASNLSCYGYARHTTPHLDRLAEQGVVYENAFTTSSWSLPTHASLFTGLYPTQHGADDHHKFLDPEIPTLAEHLHSRGYRTVGLCYNPYVSPATGLDRGFERFTLRKDMRFRRALQRVQHYAAKASRLGDAGARIVNRQARAFLKECATDTRPFFLFCHYAECHTPYRYPRSYARDLDGVTFHDAGRVNQNPWRLLAKPDLMCLRDFEILTSLYDGALRYLDDRVGELIAWLCELALDENTMVIVTADHGENLGEHGRIGHQYCLYDTLLHVPLIIRYPAGVTAPSRVREMVSLVDVVPTILELGGQDEATLGDLRGFSLLHPAARDAVFAEMSRPDFAPYLALYRDAQTALHDRTLCAFRTPEHKLIMGSDGRHELFDLQADPGETTNLVETRRDLFQALAPRLAAWQQDLTPRKITSPAPEFEPEVRNRLRALGYLE